MKSTVILSLTALSLLSSILVGCSKEESVKGNTQPTETSVQTSTMDTSQIDIESMEDYGAMGTFIGLENNNSIKLEADGSTDTYLFYDNEELNKVISSFKKGDYISYTYVKLENEERLIIDARVANELK